MFLFSKVISGEDSVHSVCGDGRGEGCSFCMRLRSGRSGLCWLCWCHRAGVNAVCVQKCLDTRGRCVHSLRVVCFLVNSAFVVVRVLVMSVIEGTLQVILESQVLVCYFSVGEDVFSIPWCVLLTQTGAELRAEARSNSESWALESVARLVSTLSHDV